MTWREQMVALRGEGFDVLDWLSAQDGDPIAITACLIRSDDPAQFRLVRADAPAASVADLFPSAAWHERETAEMFGVDFGTAAEPLLLPQGAEPALRKTTPLPERLAEWPGAVDPAKPRRRQDPPGTPWT
ncbi:MAG: NADH-quinone oxidoreductase subunit C [Candidatus Nanopelagicales bacterium]